MGPMCADTATMLPWPLSGHDSPASQVCTSAALLGFEKNGQGGTVAERSASEWNELAAEGRRILWGVARNGDLVEYGSSTPS